ncbi:uncharacterized protein LOC126291543 [Schistocerca gregaria]|uniref:uncharacterized protein LOC126291543 n=1 Tax=Schistocerca gregaria TaxID=7010 RepID=UPI00211ECCAC|nr:uncharacterized protein LOC126291543 [Schistocerca gregaria]
MESTLPSPESEGEYRPCGDGSGALAAADDDAAATMTPFLWRYSEESLSESSGLLQVGWPGVQERSPRHRRGGARAGAGLPALPKAPRVPGGTWLSEAPNSDFGLSKYCASFSDISGKQESGPVTCVLMTNARLGERSLDLFERRDARSVPGLELLLAGGDLYQLNQNSRQVWKAVRSNASFVEHFYLLCKQRDSVEIARDICRELEQLLGAGDLCGTICDSLCKGVRQWMNNQSVCLTSGWSQWQQLVDENVGKEVSEWRAVTTGLRYCSVGVVRAHVESCNPAWVRPPERGAAALTATKLHQALIRETNVMVAVERYAERQDWTLRCWGPFCRWLVIADDDREGNRVILDELLSQTQSEHRLVIVSSKEGDCFSDECNSSDVSDDSWNRLLDVEVRLNGDGYRCCLRDLLAGAGAAESLKSLLAGEPALLLALVCSTCTLDNKKMDHY